MGYRAHNSVGQSSGLIIRLSKVRALVGPPPITRSPQMIITANYAPGQRVSIVDAELTARVMGVLFTDRGVSYICRWYDGQEFQENEFGDSELSSTGTQNRVAAICGASDEKGDKGIAEKVAEANRRN